MLVSIVVPCFNEELNVPLVAEKFSDALKAFATSNTVSFSESDFELLLVDNGSKDRTREAISTAKASFPFVRQVNIDNNTGYGNGIYSGLRQASGEYVGWTHADLQTNPADVFTAIDLILKARSVTYVKGRRRKRPLLDVFFTRGMSLFETILFRTKLSDINAQPSLFSRNLLVRFENAPIDFSFDLYALIIAKKHNYIIQRFPVEFINREHGQSSWNDGLRSRLRFVKRTVDYSLRLRFNR